MKNSINRISALARLVVVDGLRRHALLGLVALALGIELSGLFFFAFVPRDIGRVTADFVVTIGWCAGMLFLFFHAVSVMSWGEDRRVIHTLLARPLSRTEYVLGVFSGLLLLLFLLNVLLGGIGYGVLVLIKSWVGESFFSRLGVWEYLLAWWGVLGIEAMILSSIVLFSGLLRGSFTVLLVTLSYYLICNGLPVAIEFFKGTSKVAPKILVGLTLIFPNFYRFDYKGSIVALGKLPDVSSLALNAAYVLLYCALVLTLAAGIYNRRDLK
jgi:ABC-type transport system involved in multi-copper enzyme maturation permease subunit